MGVIAQNVQLPLVVGKIGVLLCVIAEERVVIKVFMLPGQPQNRLDGGDIRRRRL